MIVYANNTNVPYEQQRGWLIDEKSVEPHEDHVYHLIEIEDDRYSGTYSGHGFTAWPGIRPTDIDGGDTECMEFWDQWRDKALYGGGNTAQEAFRDLIQKMETLGINIIEHDDPEWSNLRVVMLHGCVTRTKAMLYDSDEFRTWLGDVVAPLVSVTSFEPRSEDGYRSR